MKIKYVIISIVILLCVILVIYASPWLMLYTGVYLSPNPLKPEIRHGEFNFKLEYEINGEIRTLNDTLICEFDGFNIDEGRGKTRRWKEYFKNLQNNELYAFRIEVPEYYKPGRNEPKYNQIVLQNTDHYKIVLSVASAEYFLGEPDYKATPEMPYVQVYDTNIQYYKDPNQSKAFLDGYGFKIISWYCDPPIQNSFK